MEIVILYKKGQLRKGLELFHHFLDTFEYIKYYRDRRIIELINGDIIQLIEFYPQNIRGIQCDLIYIDKNITIEEMYNEIFGRYNEAIFY